MLRSAREQAESKAGAEAAVSTAEADAAVEAANAERRAAAERLGSELKSSAASTYESTTSRYRGFGGFSAPAPTPAPAPAAEPQPAPAPKASFFSAPRAEPKPEPVVEVKKQASAPAPAKKVEEAKTQAAGKQKRRGPLPLFLAEVLVLGSFAGFVLAVTKYSEETNKALAMAGAKAKELYNTAEQAIAKAQQAK
ncbi:hypothetical protein GPECTOR_7g1118 [Gonium pectorale]|uniref:Uncharacterized protein n=1 Tax=Gonium pectorale TaxID=33097 RepID=A0A150GTN6_GONPE|nr:hypothetical protein GPECTOR_7g1118 [Gonium pectorale]|eukprot:KXZ53225.1 hypothetical protein GPECTOR_7g1118 [Gonium pectorale]